MVGLQASRWASEQSSIGANEAKEVKNRVQAHQSPDAPMAVSSPAVPHPSAERQGNHGATLPKQRAQGSRVRKAGMMASRKATHGSEESSASHRGGEGQGKSKVAPEPIEASRPDGQARQATTGAKTVQKPARGLNASRWATAGAPGTDRHDPAKTEIPTPSTTARTPKAGLKAGLNASRWADVGAEGLYVQNAPTSSSGFTASGPVAASTRRRPTHASSPNATESSPTFGDTGRFHNTRHDSNTQSAQTTNRHAEMEYFGPESNISTPSAQAHVHEADNCEAEDEIPDIDMTNDDDGHSLPEGPPTKPSDDQEKCPVCQYSLKPDPEEEDEEQGGPLEFLPCCHALHDQCFEQLVAHQGENAKCPIDRVEIFPTSGMEAADGGQTGGRRRRRRGRGRGRGRRGGD
jgi:hypothetical protein